jgi:hypothetical protein
MKKIAQRAAKAVFGMLALAILCVACPTDSGGVIILR